MLARRDPNQRGRDGGRWPDAPPCRYGTCDALSRRSAGEAEEIGRRARRARLRLGITQADLAAALGRTQRWVSKMERGQIELDRVGLLNQLAAELHVHPNDLAGRPYVASVAENQWQAAATSIVRELRRFDLVPVFDGTPRSSAALWGQMTRLHRLRDDAANVAILRVLPDMLREARALAESSAGHEREEAFALYGVMCKFCRTAAHALGHPELVAMACERAAWAASLSGDPVLEAVADWMRAWDMWATADWADSLALLDKALASIEQPWARGDQLGHPGMGVAAPAGRGGGCPGLRPPTRHATGSPTPRRPPTGSTRRRGRRPLTDTH